MNVSILVVCFSKYIKYFVGWYRFILPAGTQLSENSIAKRRCGTHSTGWLNGVHPTRTGQRVNRTVCFHWYSNKCNWSTNIEIRHCGNFFLYRLEDVPTCQLRYCATVP